MVPYSGDFAEDATVYLMFNTFTSDDPSASSTITNFINTDVHIHKDDGLTQRNNAAGITVSVDFDGITGSHMIKIDTSDDTVAAFWVTGSDYFVRIEGTTIDGATVNAVVGHFSIENRYTRGTDSAALASVLGALNDAAADGDPTAAETLMQYVKQLINVLVGSAGIPAFPAEAGPANDVSLAEVIRAIHADVTGLNGSAMIGTNGANTTTPPTVGEIQTEMEEDGASLLDTIRDILEHGTYGLSAIEALVDELETRLTAVRAGYLDELAAANLPAVTDGIQTDLNNATDGLGALKSLIDALNDLSSADVNAEVVDALNVDTYAEPGQEAPGDTISLAAKINHLYKGYRNKKDDDGTTRQLYNAAGLIVDQKSTLGEAAGVVTIGEVVSGP